MHGTKNIFQEILSDALDQSVNFWLVMKSPLLPAQNISDYTDDMPVTKYRYTTPIHRYILPIPTCKYKYKKENISCWCESLVKLTPHPWM
jgi:hypothetical protein